MFELNNTEIDEVSGAVFKELLGSVGSAIGSKIPAIGSDVGQAIGEYYGQKIDNALGG